MERKEGKNNTRTVRGLSSKMATIAASYASMSSWLARARSRVKPDMVVRLVVVRWCCREAKRRNPLGLEERGGEASGGFVKAAFALLVLVRLFCAVEGGRVRVRSCVVGVGVVVG